MKNKNQVVVSRDDLSRLVLFAQCQERLNDQLQALFISINKSIDDKTLCQSLSDLGVDLAGNLKDQWLEENTLLARLSNELEAQYEIGSSNG